MPYSFTQIEKDKGRVISLVFLSLILFYFLTAFILYISCKNLLLAQYSLKHFDHAYHWGWISFREAVVLFAAALVCGLGHWIFTVNNLVEKILGLLKAERLSPEDKYHVMFKNIIDEVSVATGGKNIEGVVIPTTAMNAFAIADFSGRNIIGVTEGLLARLSRAQIEAVVGHEAAHIVSGDCLSTTVTTSIFELYKSALKGMRDFFSQTSSSNNRSGGIIPVMLVAYAILSIASFMGQLLRMFVSRQRELRADAVAVRLTRDPLSLAEALRSVSSRWRGAGLAGENLEAIFIVNPRFDQLDEREGVVANIFSTHPPVSKRLNVLLDMAHSDVAALEQRLRSQQGHPRTLAPESFTHSLSAPVNANEKSWIANKDGQWQGPYSLLDLTNLGWMQADTWVKKIGSQHIEQAFDNMEIRDSFWKKSDQTTFQCPKCHVGLSAERYEGTCVYRCYVCGGAFVKENNINRIVIRSEYDFSSRIKELARQLSVEARKKLPAIDLKNASLYSCPQCQHPKTKMLRVFYTLAYPVIVDKCSFCGFLWLDKDELEILQCMIEEANQGDAKFI